MVHIQGLRRKTHLLACLLIALITAFTPVLLPPMEASAEGGYRLAPYDLPVKDTGIGGMTIGPDNNIWLTLYGTNKIVRMTTAGAMTTFTLPQSSTWPRGITAGPDGNIWYTQDHGIAKVGRLSPDGTVKEFPIPSKNDWATAIVRGSDGNMWFGQAGSIARVTTSGAIKEFKLAYSGAVESLALGPDGNVWFTQNNNMVGRITPSGAYKAYFLPGEYDYPYGITPGPDGNMWFTRAGGFGKITPDGQILTYSHPAIGARSLTKGPDGNMWFTANNEGAAIGSIPTNGSLNLYPLPGVSPLSDILLGPDGKLWVGIPGSGQVARVEKGAPAFKQTDPAWANDEYAFSNTYGPYDCGRTIKQCGCAITSSAMLLRYYGYHKLPDGSELNPKTLNAWLKNNNGYYARSGDLKWAAIAKLSRDALGANGITAFHGLEFDSKTYPKDINRLRADLQAGQPDILNMGGHFILATGVSGNTFTVNDPARDIQTLDHSRYGNTFQSMRRFTVAHTDFSYITVKAGPDTTITLLDEAGNPIGEQFIENGITDPLDDTAQPGAPSKYLYAAQPESGKYTLSITAAENTPATAFVDVYDKEGESRSSEQAVTGTEQVAVNFNKEDVQQTSIGQPADTAAPVTTAAQPAAPTSAGWHKQNVTVQLKAADNPGGSGVKNITYSLDGAQDTGAVTVPGNTATVPAITAEGPTTISFHATDNAGNKEQPRTLVVKLDKTAPEASFQFDAATKRITGTGVDGLSGVATATQDASLLTVTDKAGNTTRASFTGSRIVSHNNKSGLHTLRLTALTYNGKKANIPPAGISAAWQTHDKKNAMLSHLLQTASVGSSQYALALYAQPPGMTVGAYTEDGHALPFTRPGLSLTRLVSDKGSLHLRQGN